MALNFNENNNIDNFDTVILENKLQSIIEENPSWKHINPEKIGSFSSHLSDNSKIYWVDHTEIIERSQSLIMVDDFDLRTIMDFYILSLMKIKEDSKVQSKTTIQIYLPEIYLNLQYISKNQKLKESLISTLSQFLYVILDLTWSDNCILTCKNAEEFFTIIEEEMPVFIMNGSPERKVHSCLRLEYARLLEIIIQRIKYC